MNIHIPDNTIKSLNAYLNDQLSGIYDSRESQNIIAEIFFAYKGWSRADVIMNNTERLSESELLKFHFALKRLTAGEPLQYVLGYSFFYGKKIHVNPSVLIPRPETEELVSNVLRANKLNNPDVLDIGTGSGCIAISIKSALPDASVWALDISNAALDLASQNAVENGQKISFYKLNILTELPSGKFDIIISNPPYIPFNDSENMRSQVKDFEPEQALFVDNADPLIFYRRILFLSQTLLKPGGDLWFEIHEDKKTDLEKLLADEMIQHAEFYKDMQGKYRMLYVKGF